MRAISLGDRVGIQPLFSSCLKCEYCIEARGNLCKDAEITGETVQVGYAEYILAREDFVTPIPDSIDSESAAPLICPGITAYKAVKAVGPARGKSVGVFGIGVVGHLAIQITKLNGLRVVAVSRSKNHTDLAAKLGADSIHALLESKQASADVAIVGLVSTVGEIALSLIVAKPELKEIYLKTLNSAVE